MTTRAPGSPRSRRTSSTSTPWSPRTTTSAPTRPIRPSGSRSARPATAVRRSRPRSTRRTSWPRPRPSAAIGPPRATTGPLFIGRDTHALSEPAWRTALEVLVANGVDVRVDAADGYTPTPAISHAILVANRDRPAGGGLADGIVVTPSHNPPEDGGFKYNPPNGGPADTDVTRWIQDEANRILEASGSDGLDGIARVPFDRARASAGAHDYVGSYVGDLGNVVDMAAIAGSGLRIGVDPLGGAAVDYWGTIGERYGLDLTVTNPAVDPTFGFMTLDWDGRIRMDPSSRFAMARLVELRDRFDLALGNDADADRHGIVVPGAGLHEPQPRPRGRHRLPVRRGARLGRGRRRRQDAGVVLDHRPRRGRPRPAAGRGPGRVQVVRGRARRRLDRVRRRGERRGVVPAPRRHGLDHRQGRDHGLPARGRAHGADRAQPGGGVRGADRAVRGAGLPPDRRPGDAGAEGRPRTARGHRRAGDDAGRRRRSRPSSRPRRATARRSAGSRSRRPRRGSPPGRRARRTSPSCTRRASAARRTSRPCSRRPPRSWRGRRHRKAPPTSGGNVDGADGLDRLAVGLG